VERLRESWLKIRTHAHYLVTDGILSDGISIMLHLKDVKRSPDAKASQPSFLSKGYLDRIKARPCDL
jgi:hypothetical protein